VSPFQVIGASGLAAALARGDGGALPPAPPPAQRPGRPDPAEVSAGHRASGARTVSVSYELVPPADSGPGADWSPSAAASAAAAAAAARLAAPGHYRTFWVSTQMIGVLVDLRG